VGVVALVVSYYSCVVKICYNSSHNNEVTPMSTVTLTDKAAAKVWELIQEEGNFNLKLRAYVTGGGCSGMQYGFTFTEVHLLVDPMSFQYLAEATIDYKDDIEGEQFIIRNPNAKTTCGCGSSFAVE
jgi:iron-sulfur cluster insertion protein